MPEMSGRQRPERQPAGDAERGERDDERVGHAALDEDEAVHGAHREARAEDHGDREPRRVGVPKASAPTTDESATVAPPTGRSRG